ncbi:MAG: GFA family protein [Pseudomonadota bacterium]
MSMPQKQTGACACGSIRFSVQGDPVLAANCHCRDCQRATGSAFAPIMIFWKHDFTLLSGTMSWHEKQADTGRTMRRTFCSDCGSPIGMLNVDRPKLVYLYASSFDDPSAYTPAMDIFMDSAQAWRTPCAGTALFDRMPPVPDDLGT